MDRPRYRVPDELRETLLDFTIAYLLERPPNLIEFGIQFFQRLKGEREQSGSGASSGRNSQGALNGRSNEIDEVEGKDKDKDKEQEASASLEEPKKPIPVSNRNCLLAGADPNHLILDERDATWLWHFAAKYILETPMDIVTWGLEYCLNERDRWAYE